MNCKKLPITIILLLLTLTTTSCEPNNWRINYLIPGYFIGVNTYNEEETFYLTVKEITLEEYKNANGNNVIEDDVRPNYFSLKLYSILNNERIDFNFNNLKPYSEDVTNWIDYIDDYDTWLTPYNPPIGTDKYFYKIHLVKYNAYIYFYIDQSKYS